MMNNEESLMKLGAPTTQEKLLWERKANKELIEENKKIKKDLIELSKKFFKYKVAVEKNHVAQMLNKLNKVKERNVILEDSNIKLKREVEDLQCLLAKANLKLKEQNKPETLWLRLKKKFNW